MFHFFEQIFSMYFSVVGHVVLIPFKIFLQKSIPSPQTDTKEEGALNQCRIFVRNLNSVTPIFVLWEWSGTHGFSRMFIFLIRKHCRHAEWCPMVP